MAENPILADPQCFYLLPCCSEVEVYCTLLLQYTVGCYCMWLQVQFSPLHHWMWSVVRLH